MKIAEVFPLVCPVCGGDIRLIAVRLLSDCETLHGLRALGCPLSLGQFAVGEPCELPGEQIGTWART